jgi:hypothetical protein
LNEGPYKNWNINEVLLYLNDKFKNKKAVQTAGNELQRMHINDSQKFDSFLNDFKFKLALCKKLNGPTEIESFA